MPTIYKHDDTKKALVRGTISYLEAQGLPVNKSAIFRHFDLSRSQGYAALSSSAPKREDPEWEETRGRPNKVPEADQQKMERLLWDDKYADVGLNWQGLAKEAGVEMTCNPRTLHRTMGTLLYRRCLGCGRCWTHKRNKEKRCDYARKMLREFPQVQDWRAVRFSGELHFGFGLDGRIRVHPRSGERVCESCDKVPETSWPRDVKRVHAWCAIGYGFKSELVFYEDSTSANCNGQMTMATYCDRVLEKAVKPWLAGNPAGFVLEEDAELFAHGSLSKVNLAQQWKDVHGLRCHFNCGDSPDLSPLDSLWLPHKQWTGEKLRDWEDETLREAARDVWKGVEQGRVDVWVDNMVARLQFVMASEGQMVPW
ncbi:hypothetical protein PT974_07793 [Cladobotryum mycophilum]|uniref:HMG box protein n=1 Tax=Cladobotryum mycophilum TaxID=491253 RepID=A0ABR0SIB9_9HYPO